MGQHSPPGPPTGGNPGAGMGKDPREDGEGKEFEACDELEATWRGNATPIHEGLPPVPTREEAAKQWTTVAIAPGTSESAQGRCRDSLRNSVGRRADADTAQDPDTTLSVGDEEGQRMEQRTRLPGAPPKSWC